MNKFLQYSLLLVVVIASFSCKKVKVTDDSSPTPTPTPPLYRAYYVSANTGSDNNIGVATTLAFKTIAKAAALTQPGDTVYIMNGVYSASSNPLLTINRSGLEGKNITYKALKGNTPKLTASGNVWNLIIVDANYIVIDGLEMEGDNANLTLAGAQASYQQSRATPAVFNANYNTNAISIGGTSTSHHITIKNCKVHDFPGGGIGAGNTDYITIEGNTIYNTSWYTMYATSGISILGPKPIDAVTTYKMIIRGNTVYGNKTQVFWRTSSGNDRLSDGNGIILDANNGTQGTAVYTGRTLVENNVSYNNGGGGIHAFQAARVDILNNTAYNNGTVVGYPEIDGQQGVDVKIFNNIMYARTGGNCNANDASVTYNYNIYFNGPAFRTGANDRTINPQFISLSTNPTTANFSLQLGSPAINTGTQALFAPKDILGVTRPKGGAVDIGAYEVN
jgi:hypothetical protein